MDVKGLVRATALIYSMHFKTVFGSKRVLAAMVLAAMPPVLGGLGARLSPETVEGVVMDGEAIFASMGILLFLGFVVPMLSVSVAVGAVADEVETRTITFPFTRPIPRASLFLGRWLAALTLIFLLVTASAVLLWFMTSRRGSGPSLELFLAILQAALVGSFIYSIGAAVIGTEFKRGLVIALAYAFAFELLVANTPGSSRALTVQYHLRAMVAEPVARAIPGTDWLFSTERIISSGAALTKMLVISGLLLSYGCWRVGRKQFVLSS